MQRLYLHNNSLSSLDETRQSSTASPPCSSSASQDNSLSSLAADTFDGLTALNTLYLNDNNLSSLAADTFDGLTALNTLYLNDNSLTTLDADIFDGLGNLKTLYLNDNGLTGFPPPSLRTSTTPCSNSSSPITACLRCPPWSLPI